MGTGWICEHLCTRRVSLQDWGDLGKNILQQFHNQRDKVLTSKQHPTSTSTIKMAARTMKYYIAFQALHANMNELYNCISRYCKVSLLVVHHIAFHGLEPLS